ncbi:MAG TPA: PspC domain-containing protein [bacterium]
MNYYESVKQAMAYNGGGPTGGATMAGKLQKGRNRILLGVAGGIAEYFKIDPVIVRVIFILLVFANGLGVLLYALLALLMPKPEGAAAKPLAVVKENLKMAPQEAMEAGRRAVAVLRGPAPEIKESAGKTPPQGNGSGSTVP